MNSLIALLSCSWPAPSITPDGVNPPRLFQVTHPFHPLDGREFALVTCRHNWGEDRVYFRDDGEWATSVPTAWTSISAADPFVAVSADRSPFKAQDLLDVPELIQAMMGGTSRCMPDVDYLSAKMQRISIVFGTQIACCHGWCG